MDSQNRQDMGEPVEIDPTEGLPLADYPKRSFPKREIKAAGAALREALPYTEDAVQFFRVAHNWRMAHAYPMMQERIRLSRVVGTQGDTAGRIKRMDSIRKKLRRSGIGLDQMQDLAGIRAIVDDMSQVERISAWYHHHDRVHRIKRMDNYISNPKPGGYRSLHIVTAYDGAGEDWRGHKVEIQVRTRLQHVWATAVEAVGAMRGEDLKAGEGGAQWLRLLELMGAYLAGLEGMPAGAHVPQDRAALLRELRQIEKAISAVEVLSAFRAVVQVSAATAAKYFVVHLDAAKGRATVTSQASLISGSEGYFRATDAGEAIQTVMVAVDDASALRRAFPNYFLDVGEFVMHLRDATDKLTMIERVRFRRGRY